MNAKDSIAASLRMSGGITKMYLADLGDADLLARPVPGSNHIAWQVGHVLSSESRMVAAMGGTRAELPEGFDKRHGKEAAASDAPGDFHTKAEYLEFHARVRAATTELLASMPDARLDEASTGPMAPFAPTLGEMFLLIANHEMMHTGQFTVVRRKLGKPVLF